ncbi:cysteine desulfurase [bacterium]|nr:cysteine desulfurase [bacterium]
MAYLDRISGTGTSKSAMAGMIKYMNYSALNPQSPGKFGTRARQALDTARLKVAELIGADIREITFVSNGTESVNLAIQGLVQSAAKSKEGRKIIISSIEHTSVMNTVKALEKKGFQTEIIPVDKFGRVDFTKYVSALDENTLLVSIQLANPEIGTIQDIASLAAAAREKNILFHTDAVDAVGWIPVNVPDLGVDALSFSGTQFQGPPGAAALFVRKGVSLVPMMFGGLQEKHRRPGLENIPAIAGFGIAAEETMKSLAENVAEGQRLASTLRKGLEKIENITLTGHPEYRIPGHVSVLIHYVEGEALLLMLDMKDIQAASGSSCTAKDLKISPVLMALGTDHTSAQGSLVFSTTTETSDTDIQLVLETLPVIVKRLRSMSPLWNKKK